MKTLLVIDSSGRRTRSITRHLTARFAQRWRGLAPSTLVIGREVGVSPPPVVDEAWIAAAYSPPETWAVSPALAYSEEAIAELLTADAVVLAAPMYNFGLPAQLKAYFDQIVRVGRTFAFDPAATEPYRPLVTPRPVVVVTSAGDGAIHPGGALHAWNHLEPHLRTLLGFIGLGDVTFVRAAYDEYQDDRSRRSLARAEAEVDACVDRLVGMRPRGRARANA